MIAAASKRLTRRGRAAKRTLDIAVSIVVFAIAGWLIPLAALAARLSTGGSGVFRQTRVGRDGRLFTVLKLRTMRTEEHPKTTVTAANDPCITRVGRVLRRTQLDELPQLINVLRGDMSLVGPRPDVPGFADELEGVDRLVLVVRPGLTGPATLRFRNEEALLAGQRDPERYNRDVLWPEKVRINRKYVQTWRFRDDIRYLWLTARGVTLNDAHVR